MRKFHRFLAFTVALLILYLVYRYSFQVDSDGHYLFLKPLEATGSGSGRGYLTLLQSADGNENDDTRESPADPKRLVNLTDFRFQIGNDICKENGSFSELLGEWLRDLGWVIRRR